MDGLVKMYDSDTKIINHLQKLIESCNYIKNIETTNIFLQTNYEENLLLKLFNNSTCYVGTRECFFRNLFVEDELSELKMTNIVSKLTKFKEQTTNYTIVGSGGSGNVVLVNIEMEKFIVKFGKNKKNNPENIHEFLVGYICLNELRNLLSCPNFAYIYGIFQCPGTIIENGEIKSICNFNDISYSTDNIFNVIDEYINGTTLYESIKNEKLSVKNLLYLFIQILNALYIAQKNFEFTHYDLHLQNIICRKVDIERYYVKAFNNSHILSEINIIPTIIDFGSSHVKVNDKNLGFTNLNSDLSYFILNSMFPLYDAYKLLMAILLSVIDENLELYSKIKSLQHFFNPELTDSEMLNNVKYQRELYYTLPYTKNTAKNELDYENFVLTYLKGNDKEYSKGLTDYKLNDLKEFIEYCCDFCEKSGFPSPMIKEEDLDNDTPIVTCRNGEIYFE